MIPSRASNSELYGLLAQFDQPEALRDAAYRAHREGFRRMDAYSPFPIHDLMPALGRTQSQLPSLTLLGAVLGGVAGYLMQYYASVVSYPLNVGGRPYHSWPAFIPVTFELAILGAAAFTVLGMLGLSGLPMPYHPLFHIPEFKSVSRDQFFLCIQSTDPLFDLQRTHAFLEALHPTAIFEVPR